MTKKGSSPFSILVIFLLILLCGSIMGSLWGLDRIPRWTEATFGAAAPGISQWEKLNLGLRLWVNESKLVEAVDPDGTEQEFQVSQGESAISVAQRLEDAGLIKNADVFRLYLIYSGIDRRIQAGDYVLNSSMTGVEIAQKIQDASSSTINFTILPGWRAEEIGGILENSGFNVRAEEFIQMVHHPEGIVLPSKINKQKSLEGYLYPGQYRAERTTSTADFIQLFIHHFDEKVTPEMLVAFRKSKLSLPQAITLASMVEREAMQSEEKPLIASVFINRLNQGMALASDPTVQYALGYNNKQNTWWTNPLSYDDLKVESPYNTYIHSGLPPGPISNPGFAALNAVAHPANTQYLYFRARCDGSGLHNFARTYEEHLQNECPQ